MQVSNQQCAEQDTSNCSLDGHRFSGGSEILWLEYSTEMAAMIARNKPKPTGVKLPGYPEAEEHREGFAAAAWLTLGGVMVLLVALNALVNYRMKSAYQPIQ